VTLGRALRTAIILVAVLATAAVSFAVAGVAASPSAGKNRPLTTVSIGSAAKLAVSPYGPGANVTVSYSCFPGFGGKGGYSGFASVSLGDLQGNQGYANFSPRCTNSKQTAVVFIPGHFVAGAGEAVAYVCGFDCNGATRKVSIR
jgi:hypothetical protein